jgi:hypothetical protein
MRFLRIEGTSNAIIHRDQGSAILAHRARSGRNGLEQVGGAVGGISSGGTHGTDNYYRFAAVDSQVDYSQQYPASTEPTHKSSLFQCVGTVRDHQAFSDRVGRAEDVIRSFRYLQLDG